MNMRVLPNRFRSFKRWRGVWLVWLVFLLALMGWSGPAAAEDQDDQEWGCTLLLCFANPAGPMAAPACVPPVRRMLVQMAKFWKAFQVPTCLAGNEKGSRLALLPASYPACPEGMTALDAGVKVVMTSPDQARLWQETDARMLIGRLADDVPPAYGTEWREVQDQGIGEGDQEMQSALRDGREARPKICVGEALGQAQVPLSLKDERGHVSSYVDETHSVFLFGQVVRVAPPQGRIHYQVFVDHKPFMSGSLQ